MGALVHLKGTVSDRLKSVQKDLTAIVGFFKGYDEDQRQRGSETLKKGVSFFEDLLKIDANKIIQAVEEEISFLQAKLDQVKANKSKEISNQISAIVLKDLPDLDFIIQNEKVLLQQ